MIVAARRRWAAIPGAWREGLGLFALLGGLAALLIGPAMIPGSGAIFAPSDLIVAGLPGYPDPPSHVGNPILGDVVYAIEPWRLLAQEEWAAGRLPLWNNRQLLGTPLL